MEVEECIKTRRSIRKFLGTRIPKEKIVNILEAGRMAPTAGNLQNHEVIVVTEADLKNKVAEACLQQYWIAKAPVVLVVVAEHDVQKKHYGKRGELYSVQSAANVAMNMILTAHSLGVASCWVGAFDNEIIRRALNIPGKITPLTVIPLGTADEEVPAPSRKAFYSTIWIETYGNQVKDIGLALGQYSGVIEKKAKEARKNIEKGAGSLFTKVKEKIKKKK